MVVGEHTDHGNGRGEWSSALREGALCPGDRGEGRGKGQGTEKEGADYNLSLFPLLSPKGTHPTSPILRPPSYADRPWGSPGQRCEMAQPRERERLGRASKVENQEVSLLLSSSSRPLHLQPG